MCKYFDIGILAVDSVLRRKQGARSLLPGKSLPDLRPISKEQGDCSQVKAFHSQSEKREIEHFSSHDLHLFYG